MPHPARPASTKVTTTTLNWDAAAEGVFVRLVGVPPAGQLDPVAREHRRQVTTAWLRQASQGAAQAITELLTHMHVRHDQGGQVNALDRQVGELAAALFELHKARTGYRFTTELLDGERILHDAAADAEGDGIAGLVSVLLDKLCAGFTQVVEIYPASGTSVGSYSTSGD